MKNYFKTPETAYTDLIDIGKFDMIWRVNYALFFIFLFLFFIRLFLGDENIMTSLLAFGVSVLNFVILWKTRKYMLVSLISVILGIGICQVLFFVMHDDRILADALWVILVSFFSFFMLGILAGYLAMLINLTGLLLYLTIRDQHGVSFGNLDGDSLDIGMIVNVYYVALAVGYLSHKMISTNHKINKRLQKQNEKNELLMKEIHHRVKNNLQIMSSLLKLQAAEANDERVERHFDEAIGRIRSMALIHEQMYQSENLTETNIKEFLLSLAEHITVTSGTKGNIVLDFHSELHTLDLKVLVPLSLIFNELLTNSLKHGFKDGNDGHITIEILVDKNLVHFIYKDDGIWIGPDPNRNSFGLNLIETLTDQLDGTFVRNIGNGTQYIFTFDSKLFIE